MHHIERMPRPLPVKWAWNIYPGCKATKDEPIDSIVTLTLVLMKANNLNLGS